MSNREPGKELRFVTSWKFQIVLAAIFLLFTANAIFGILVADNATQRAPYVIEVVGGTVVVALTVTSAIVRAREERRRKVRASSPETEVPKP